MYVDPNGKIPVAVITGAIGGVLGGGASLGIQIYQNKGVKNINWKSVGVAAGVGAVAGAISPWAVTSTVDAIIVGSVSNLAIGGKLSGPVPKPTQRPQIKFGETSSVSKAEAMMWF